MPVTTSTWCWSSSLKPCPALHTSCTRLGRRVASCCRVPQAYPPQKLQPGSLHRPSWKHSIHSRPCSSQHSKCRSPVCTAAAAGAAALPASSSDGVYGKAANPDPGPRSLPAPPTGSGLLQVLPYLARLAATDPQLYWRLGLASILLIISKAAGTMLKDTCVELHHFLRHPNRRSNLMQ